MNANVVKLALDQALHWGKKEKKIGERSEPSVESTVVSYVFHLVFCLFLPLWSLVRRPRLQSNEK